MFNKIVVIDNTGINNWAKSKLNELAKEVDLYNDFPKENSEIIRRIGDAECVMVSYETNINKEVFEKCKNIKYIGMCCSLYDEKSANVDISEAKKRGITVLGVKDYGDEGVIEYEISELIRLLHGFGKHQWKERPNELTNQKIGILGLGKTGLMLGKTLKFLGADVYYHNRTRNIEAEEQGITYLPFDEFLQTVNILSTHLPKNTILLKEKEFQLFGNNKILINTSIGPTFSIPALKDWLKDKSNYYLCDNVGMISCFEELAHIENVIHVNKAAGSSEECTNRLSQKVIENIYSYLKL